MKMHFSFLNVYYRFSILSIFFFTLILPFQAYPQTEDDKTLSPYFLVIAEEETNDIMPLKETSAKVNIAGVIANVNIKQVYVNESTGPIEAIYVFPGSTKSAVYGMKMSIGEREIEAKIAKQSDARAEYEQAKTEGRSASLLEQKRPNVFQMNVANILPGDEVTIELSYTETLIPEEGIYEFVYPTVVAPRYFDTKELQELMKSDAWVLNPYLDDDEEPNYVFDISTSITAGLPISTVTCPSHKVAISFPKADKSVIKLDQSGGHGGNRDFVIQYELVGTDIQSGLLLYEGEKENFFLATIQPPKSVTAKQIPPREYVFIIDVSGSMYGLPLRVVKDFMKSVVISLRPEDRFNLMLFSTGNELLSEVSLPATEENLNQAITLLESNKGGGDSQLLEALQNAFRLRNESNMARSFVVITDGYIVVERETFDLIQNNLFEANLFSVGIGQDVNRYLVEGMAHLGQGEPLIITRRDDAFDKANKFKKYIESPVLTNVEVSFDGFDAYDVEPLSYPDVLAERPIIIFGKYKGNPKGKINLKGSKSNNEIFSSQINVAETKPEKENIALKYLWARKKIEVLEDYLGIDIQEEGKNQVTQLGLDYNLLTNYTSFIATDNQVRTEKESKKVVQVLPSPSKKRIKGSSASNPFAGTASRAIGSGKVNVLLPKICPSYDSKATIKWHLTWFAPLVEKADSLEYIFTVKNIMGQKIYSVETDKTEITLDLSQEPFLSAKSILKYEVQVKGHSNLKSNEKVLKKLKPLDPSIAKIVQLKDDNSIKGLFVMANYFEEKKMYANAISTYEALLSKEDSKRNRFVYNEFLKRNGLKE